MINDKQYGVYISLQRRKLKSPCSYRSSFFSNACLTQEQCKRSPRSQGKSHKQLSMIRTRELSTIQGRCLPLPTPAPPFQCNGGTSSSIFGSLNIYRALSGKPLPAKRWKLKQEINIRILLSRTKIFTWRLPPTKMQIPIAWCEPAFGIPSSSRLNPAMMPAKPTTNPTPWIEMWE